MIYNIKKTEDVDHQKITQFKILVSMNWIVTGKHKKLMRKNMVEILHKKRDKKYSRK